MPEEAELPPGRPVFDQRLGIQKHCHNNHLTEGVHWTHLHNLQAEMDSAQGILHTPEQGPQHSSVKPHLGVEEGKQHIQLQLDHTGPGAILQLESKVLSPVPLRKNLHLLC